MVLGLRTKKKRNYVQVDYRIHLQEIKPWPSSQSSKGVQSVLLHWENSEQNNGTLESVVRDGKLEFNEFFKLTAALRPEKSKKGAANESFEKNYLDFFFYEMGKDKVVKGSMLGSTGINLADYVLAREAVAISLQISLKKSSKNAVPPCLYMIIEPLHQDGASSSPQDGLVKQTSVDTNGSGSLSELTNEGNDGECEIASFTDDDDGSSQSSKSNESSARENTRSSPPQNTRNGSESAKDGLGRVSQEHAIPSSVAPTKKEVNPLSRKNVNVISSTSSATNLPSEGANSGTNAASKVSSSVAANRVGISAGQVNFEHSLMNQANNVNTQRYGKSDLEEATAGEHLSKNQENNVNTRRYDKSGLEDAMAGDSYVSNLKEPGKEEQEREQIGQVHHAAALKKNDIDEKQEQIGQAHHVAALKKNDVDEKQVSLLFQEAAVKQARLRSNTITNNRTGMQSSVAANNKLKHLRSVQVHSDLSKSNGSISTSHVVGKGKEVSGAKDVNENEQKGREETTKGICSESKAELVSKVEMLEEELRESAAVEVGIYSVVAEHGSSTNKVHAPARRLSRFYHHACKTRSRAKMAGVARAIVSGLVLVSKACGNDVPRLTFWLSNSIVLRSIVDQLTGKLQLSNRTHTKNNADENGTEEKFSPELHESPHRRKLKSNSAGSSDDWEDPQTFEVALEKVETWIFSRIIESVWWQTLTPHMQSAAAKGSSTKKSQGKKHGLGDQEQGNFSIELWKKAFKDACERLCPVRAGGHDCGCLPELSKLVMGQLVSRLDVAMFNAILRESAEEMPTDPVSDPISDSKVLPIPAGQSSFGAGAQLKNAIGNWSIWLKDLFNIDDTDALEDMDELSDEKKGIAHQTFLKPFPLLSALSDLMMLPFEMLGDSSARKEVCPSLTVPLIKRALRNFVPDEFNPDPIPETVFETLDAEDISEAEEDSFPTFPLAATPTIYSPPPAASLTAIIGDVETHSFQRSGSAVLKIAYSSDDELSELDSPLSSINIDHCPTSTTPNWMPKETGYRKVIRFQLLREAWRDDE